eukprot:4067539-Amphidinium_carterae.1
MDGLAHARSAWYETCQRQNCLFVASCILLPMYSNMLLLACAIIADHLRFHAVGSRMPVQGYLVAFAHVLFYQSAARFHERHVVRMTHLSQQKQQFSPRSRFLASSEVYLRMTQ